MVGESPPRASGRASLAAFVPPFKVHLCWFGGPRADLRCAEIARELYALLHRPLEDDDVMQRPGADIPVEYGRDLAGLLDALERGHEAAAGVRLVILLLDQAAYLDPASRDLVQARAMARARARARAGDEVYLPIIVGGSWAPVLHAGGHAMHDAIALPRELRDGPLRKWALGAEVAVIAGRALLGKLREPAPPRPRVLASYTRADGSSLTRDLAAHLRNHTPVDVWLDASELPSDESDEALVRQLEAAESHGVVLVIRTDRYSESPWRDAELLAAKLARVPIVTLLATTHGEVVASAHGGNHRTVTWRPGREWEVAARCVQAWLHGHYFRAYAAAALARAGLPADAEIVPRRPELVDLVGARSGGAHLLVHPDPPLTASEAALLRTARPSLRIATPTTLLGRVLLSQDPEPPLWGITIAFSISVAEELPQIADGRVGTGVTQDHVDDVMSAIVLATLSSGARIAHGGSFRRQSYTSKLAELHRAQRRLGTRAGAQLVCYLDEDGGRGGSGDALELQPVLVLTPDGADAFPGLRSNLWHLAMRDAMAAQCHARIVLGGKLRPSAAPDDGGYTGPWPGVLEEAWRTLQRDRALYIVGGLGGAAGAIAAMLASGEPPPELTRAHHAGQPVEALGRALDVARAALPATPASIKLELSPGRFAGIEDLARLVLDRWRRFKHEGDQAAWNNGLTVAENEQLFRSTDHTEITHLIFEGLRRIAPRRDGELKVMLYHGDLATVPDVDGYAVTVTPGLPRVGACGALERRLKRPLAGTPRRGGVSLDSLGAAGLPGSQVLVAQLALPPAGETLGTDAVVPLAREIGEQCDELGIEILACTAFGATLGLDAGESARAIVTAMRNNRRRLPTRLVLCERDRARYEVIRAALGASALELRAGPPTVRAADGAVLYVDVDEPVPEKPGRARSTLLLPSSSQPVVPRHEAPLAWQAWERLRAPTRRFEDTVRLGRELWDELLSDEIRDQLGRHADQRLVVLGNDTANGLPWELLTEELPREMPPRAAAPASAWPLSDEPCTGSARGAGGPPVRSIVRRVALSGAARPPAGRGDAARLQVLLVVNPTRDLPHAALEADEIEHLLRSRPDVAVSRLEGAAATVAAVATQLQTGAHDVLHYAGHARFDDAEPGRGGLVLADDVLTAAAVGDRPPRLVYLSACRSGRVRDVEPAAFGPPPSRPAPRPPRDNGRSLAEAFLRAGASALIGTFFMVDDGNARRFAAIVHAELAAGRSLGTAVSEARRRLREERVLDWGNFLLYGDDGMIL